MKFFSIEDWIRIQEAGPIKFSKSLTDRQHNMFNELCGNIREIHTNDEIALSMGFRKKVSIGLLTELLLIPWLQDNILGEGGIGVGWTIDFFNSLYVGEELTFECQLVEVRKSIRSSVLKVNVTDSDSMLIARISVRCKLIKEELSVNG